MTAIASGFTAVASVPADHTSTGTWAAAAYVRIQPSAIWLRALLWGHNTRTLIERFRGRPWPHDARPTPGSTSASATRPPPPGRPAPGPRPAAPPPPG